MNDPDLLECRPMNISTRRRRQLLLILGIGTLVVVGAATIPPVRDVLAVVVAFGLVGIFVAIRFVAAPLAQASDRPWDLWGGMGTHDELWSGQLPDQPAGREVLPDGEPTFDGHPTGEKPAQGTRSSQGVRG